MIVKARCTYISSKLYLFYIYILFRVIDLVESYLVLELYLKTFEIIFIGMFYIVIDFIFVKKILYLL